MDGELIAPQAGAMQFGDYVVTRTPKSNGVLREHEGVTFLKWLDASGRHNLVGLDPEKKRGPDGRSFEPDQWLAMEKWIREREGRLNLYYSANEPRAGSPHDKLADRDIASIRCLCADLDPQADEDIGLERERIKAATVGLVGNPSIVDSGGGFQVVWSLREKLDAQRYGASVRAQSRSIKRSLGGDAVAVGLSCVMRLPGTTNLPDAKKKARGRAPSLARRVIIGGRCTTLELSARFPPIATPETVADADEEIAKVQASLDMTAIYGTLSIDNLSSDVRARFRRLLDTDEHARRLWEGDELHLGKDKSRSAFRAALAAAMGRAGGFTAQGFGEVLAAWDFALADGDELDARTIARDWVRCGCPHAAESWFAPIPLTEPSLWDCAPQQIVDPMKGRFDLTHCSVAAAGALEAAAKPLIKGLLDTTALSVLYGPSGAGKTFAALDIAWHVATGTGWNGKKVRQTAVVYLAAEGSRGAMKRISALGRRFGVDLAIVPLHFRLANVDLFHADADLSAAIDAIAAVPDVGLVIVDTLSAVFAGGDENSPVDMGTLVKNLNRLRAGTAAHVMSVHHTGKEKAKGARGHSLLKAALDTELEVLDGRLTATKQREIETGFSLAFGLDVVQLGHDEDGDPITSCVVRWTPSGDAPTEPPTPAEAEMLRALVALNDTERASATGVSVKAIVEKLATTGRAMSENSARTNLGRMRVKKLVWKIGGKMWAPNPACCASVGASLVGNSIGIPAQQNANLAQQDIFA